jgi:HK97 family phage portal protein
MAASALAEGGLMGLFDRLMTGMSASTPGPTDDFWYGPAGGVMTASGQRVDTETARKLSAWYRGREILATSLAMLPLKVFERLPNDDGSEVARDHPLYDVLHDRPNTWQDAFVWKRQAMYHLIDHGNAYNLMATGVRGFADQLRPVIDPTTVRPELLSNYSKVFRIRDINGNTVTKTQDDVFHIMGASDDGVEGKGILRYARESIGLGQATESYAQRLFSQGTLHGGVISVPGLLDDGASERMAKSWVTAAHNWHMPKVAEQGATYTESTMSPEDYQMLESRKYTVDDIARWLGVPRMMLENSDPSYGNADQFSLNFIKFTLGGWLSAWEFACNSQLILNPKRFYVEFVRDALERADLATRTEANVEKVNAGIETVNEVRRSENRRRIPGEADTLRIPQNIVGKPLPEGRRGRAVPVQDDDSAQARAIVVASAARVLRKEVARVSALGVKHARDVDAFAVAVTDFYADHVALVVAELMMPEAAAKEYCDSQAAQVLGELGIKAIEQWSERTYAAGLAAWALESEAA